MLYRGRNPEPEPWGKHGGKENLLLNRKKPWAGLYLQGGTVLLSASWIKEENNNNKTGLFIMSAVDCITAVCCIPLLQSFLQEMIMLQKKPTTLAKQQCWHKQTWKEKSWGSPFIHILCMWIHTAEGESTLLIMYHGSDWSSISMSTP